MLEAHFLNFLTKIAHIFATQGATTVLAVNGKIYFIDGFFMFCLDTVADYTIDFFTKYFV